MTGSAPAPYFTVTTRFRAGDRVAQYPDRYLVHRAGLLRPGMIRSPLDAPRRWYTLTRTERALIQLRTANLQPLPQPRLSRVLIGATMAEDADSYGMLFTVALPVARRGAPAFRRLLNDWIPIDIETRRPSPWSDSAAEFWIAKGRNRLLRDGQVLLLPHGLARRIRHATSLRGFR